MNRSKLTPCRKVGLSRKKNTPLKTVESFLNKDVNIATEITGTPNTQSLKKIANHKQIDKSEVNSDTPCRQVGLSRKRKTSTPCNFEINKNVCTPSPSNHCKNKTSEDINNTRNNFTKTSSHSSYMKNNVEKNYNIEISKSNEENPVSCAKKLSNLFSSPKAKRKQNDVENSQYAHLSEDKSNTNSDKISCVETISSKSLSDGNMENITLNELPSINSFNSTNNVAEKLDPHHSLVQSNIGELNETTVCDKTEHNPSLTPLVPLESSTKKDDDDDSTIISQNYSQFIKVCYSNIRDQKKTQNKDLNPKKPKFSCELFDDDFEMNPRQKKPKKNFERSRTDVIKKENKSVKKNKLKKCLSVGDSRPRTLTDTSIVSNFSSVNSFNECFVRLEQIRESTDQQNLPIRLQEHHSDDDFEAFTCTPKETKIKNLNNLEKEVEEKRQILDELKRAKLHKKMHSIKDLEELTARWKIGCTSALKDLLKQLNMHSQISMEMLLRKLNIPEDFLPLSQ